MRKTVRMLLLFFMLVVLPLLSACAIGGGGSSADDGTDDDASDDDAADDDSAGDDDTGESWRIETVDCGPYVGARNSIAVDSDGGAHIAYGLNFLKYAANAGGAWQIAVVDVGITPDGTFPGFGDVAIDLDSQNNVHIAYIHLTPTYLKYATNAAGPWLSASVESGVNVDCVSMAVRPNDVVDIAYSWFSNLKLVELTSDGWRKQKVDDSNNLSMTKDAAGNIHIAYDYHYAVESPSGWEIERIDNSNFRVSLSIDHNGMAHMTGKQGAGVGIYYATNADGSWQTFQLAPDGGFDSSIGVDPSGHVHVAYYSPQDYALKYVTNASDWQWETKTLDHVGEYAYEDYPFYHGGSLWMGDLSLAVDPDGYVHISYYDAVNQCLKYATNRLK